MQAELSRLLAAQSPESIDAPTDDLHQPAGKPTGDPDSAPLTEAATKASAKVKAGSGGAQHKLASLAAEHSSAAGQSYGNTILPSKPLAETVKPQALTSIKTQTYTNTDVKAAPADSPAAEGPACKHTEAANGTSQPELPMVTSNQPGEGCLSSSADSGSACTDSVLKTACTVQADPETSAAKLSQCGPDEAAVFIESLGETIPIKPQDKTHDWKPQPLVNAFAARCGSGSSMSLQEKSGGPPCISNKNASAASARSGFASTSSNVELDVDEFMQTYFGKPPQAKPINSATADPQQHW